MIMIIEDQKRSNGLRRFASSQYFQFGNVDAGKIKIFFAGHKPDIQNHLYKSVGDINIDIFDCAYPSYIVQTSICYHAENMNLPAFIIRPKDFPIKLKMESHYKRIKFNDRKFSKPYVLSGNSETKIRNILNPEIISFLFLHKNRYIEAKGNFLLYSILGVKIEAGLMDLFLIEGETVLDCFNKKYPIK